MAKIMQNGKCYGSDNSKDIRYDNTNSNMKATNTQDAITELNESLSELNKNLGTQVTYSLSGTTLTITTK